MYKIHINVKANGGNTILVLLNGVAEKLLDTSAPKLINRMSKGDMLFHCKLQASTARSL